MSDNQTLLPQMNLLLGNLSLLLAKAEETLSLELAASLRDRRRSVRKVIDDLLKREYDDWMNAQELQTQIREALERISMALQSTRDQKQLAQSTVDAIGKIDEVVNAVLKFIKLVF